MEIKNNINKDEFIEYPDNYEEIANLALFNFEKNNIIDLNKLVKIGLDDEPKNFNEINLNKRENNNIEHMNNYEDYENKEEEEEQEQEQENENNNNYQKFEDEEIIEKEGDNEIININNNNLNKIEKNNKEIKPELKLNNDPEEKINSNMNNKNKQDSLFDKISIKKKKLSNEEMKNLISKIKYTPPDWAKGLTDQDFIKKVKLFIKTEK